MKNSDIQNLVLRLHEQKMSNRQISKHLCNQVSHTTINRWIKIKNNHGKILRIKKSTRKRPVRTKKLIKRVNDCILSKKQPKSTRKLSKKLNVSRTTIQRIIKKDLGLKSYKKRVIPKVTTVQQAKRRSFAIWARKNVRKDDTKKILFSDEKCFDINGCYNRQNDRIWAVDRGTADFVGGTHQKTKFPTKVMVWLGASFNGLTRPVIINGGLNKEAYIRDILPIALEDGKKLLGEQFTFQQDNASCHTSNDAQKWCNDNFWNFWDKQRWPPNSPDLNVLDYCIWNEICQNMNWNNIKTKENLISQIKAGVNKVNLEVVRRSIDGWTKRINTILKHNGQFVL